MKTTKQKKATVFLASVWLSLFFGVAAANAASIAMNLADNDTAEAFSGGELIGPTDIDSSYWNSSIDRDSGSLAAGTKNNLIDDSGAQTTATVTWWSANTWRIDGEHTATNERKLARSYLDDGGEGNHITVSNISCKKYNLYVLFTPGSGAFYRHTDVTVNGTPYLGAGWFRITESRISYTPWTECDGRFPGNYIKVPGLTDSTLSFGSKFLRQDDGTEARGGIAGFVIEEASADSEGPAVSMAAKKLAAQEIVAQEFRRKEYYQQNGIQVIDGKILYNGKSAKTRKVSGASSDLSVRSSSFELENLFNWAKDLALSYVMTGMPGAVPCYAAANPVKEAYCLRDFEHMMLGAHFLGLDLENITMMKSVAKTATPQTDYEPSWHYDYGGNGLEIANQVPSIFEAIWASYKQYLWTGNADWINDPLLFGYYKNAVTAYLERHDNNIPNNGIADAVGQGDWEDTCTYNEGGERVKEAADGIGMQYQGFRSFAAILKARGDIDGYNTWMAKANDILNMFRTDFWEGSTYYRGRRSLTDYSAGYGKENSFLMLKTLLPEPGERAENYLDLVWDNCANDNYEAKSYLPDAFFPYGQRERGWHYMKKLYYGDVYGRTYPELSYTFVSHTIRWLVGVDADAPNNTVSTLPQLPDEVSWVEADKVPVGSKMLKVRQDGNSKTTLTNGSDSSIKWEARFIGTHNTLLVNGIHQAANLKTINGTAVSYVALPILPDQSAVVAIGAKTPKQTNSIK